MSLSKETVYDLENTYDVIADEDEEVVDKMFTQLKPLLSDVVQRNKYKADDIDDKLVQLFVKASAEKNISEKWAKGYLFYAYFDEE
jgi:hypothetical protein